MRRAELRFGNERCRYGLEATGSVRSRVKASASATARSEAAAALCAGAEPDDPPGDVQQALAQLRTR